jgi:hypothetical protein
MSFKNTHLAVANLLQSKGNLLDLSQPLVMGIINCTPDSFYQESRKQEIDEIVAQSEKMMEEEAPSKPTPVFATFKSTRLVNLHTNEQMKAKHLDF